MPRHRHSWQAELDIHREAGGFARSANPEVVQIDATDGVLRGIGTLPPRRWRTGTSPGQARFERRPGICRHAIFALKGQTETTIRGRTAPAALSGRRDMNSVEPRAALETSLPWACFLSPASGRRTDQSDAPGLKLSRSTKPMAYFMASALFRPEGGGRVQSQGKLASSAALGFVVTQFLP